MTTADYPRHAGSVAQARAFVASALETVPEELRERAVLITSELATNAVVHAGTGFTVAVTTLARLGEAAGEVRVAVTDGGGGRPMQREPVPTEPHGRGLLIAQRLADQWGIDSAPEATTVWFSLTLAPLRP